MPTQEFVAPTITITSKYDGTSQKEVVDLTGADLRKLVKKAYELSKPYGMGHAHYKSGELDEESVDSILSKATRVCLFNMDYVHGRAVKLVAYNPNGSWLLPEGVTGWMVKKWFMHEDYELNEVLKHAFETV